MHNGFRVYVVLQLFVMFWCKRKLLLCVLKFRNRKWKIKEYICCWVEYSYWNCAIDSETKCENVKGKQSWRSLPQPESCQARNSTRYDDDDDDDDAWFLPCDTDNADNIFIWSQKNVAPIFFLPITLSQFCLIFRVLWLADLAVNLYESDDWRFYHTLDVLLHYLSNISRWSK